MMATGDREADELLNREEAREVSDTGDDRVRWPPPPPDSIPRLLIDRIARLPAWQFVGLMVALAALVVLIAILVLGHSHYELLIESGATTAISAINILVAASLAWLIYLRRQGQPQGEARGQERASPATPTSFDLRSPASFWALLAAGLLFLAADELLYIHERIDWLVHDLLDKEESDLSDSLDDVVVVIYACLGLACLWYYRDELRRNADLWPPVAVGLGLAALMVLLDILTSQRPGLGGIDELWWMTAEELCKLGAQWLLLGVLWRVKCSEVDVEA